MSRPDDDCSNDAYEARCGRTFEDEDTMFDHQDNCNICCRLAGITELDQDGAA